MRGPLSYRLMAWTRSPATSCTYGAETWHLTAALLHNVRTWELKRLRDMLQMKRRSGEGNKTYNMRTSMQIKIWYQYFSILFAHQRILKAVYRVAWFEDKIHVGLEARPLHNAQNCRNALWWESASDIPAKRRRLDGVIHARQGHVPVREDILLQFVGQDWRRQRDQCESLKGMDGGLAWVLQSLLHSLEPSLGS